LYANKTKFYEIERRGTDRFGEGEKGGRIFMATATEILERMVYAFPLIKQAMSTEAGISLTDREKFLLYLPGKNLDLKAATGAPVKPGSAVGRTMQERKRLVLRFDKTLYGLPYMAVAMPLFDETGKDVIGAIAITHPVTLQENIQEMSGSMLDHISALAASSEEISAQTEEIAASSRMLTDLARESNARAQQTDQVLGLIRNIASQTNLLGLNAAIEAARVGEQGRGFGVVAEEIRKLAGTSSTSVNEVAAIIEAIRKDSEVTYNRMNEMQNAIGQIAAGVNQIAETIQKVTQNASQLDQIAETMNDQE
jgi:hypothetical protein